MHDPLEGVTPLGTIRTGANRERVPAEFEPVLNAAVSAVDPAVSLYVYGSVATGVAEPPTSDVDLLSVGMTPEDADSLSRGLSAQFSGLCRAVEIAAAQPSDFQGVSDEAYGGRVFLRHYCIHLAGLDIHSALPDFPADARAARGFNGDIGSHVERWRHEVSAGADQAQLGRRVARKSLLAVAGLVSVHDSTWTTDRARAAARWGEISPGDGDELRMLLRWADGSIGADQASLSRTLDGVVARIVDSFDRSIGLWG
jgi:hypothetical protein